MSDFLNFLNTAETESLTKTPGISNTIAENIISARPFESVDDCLKVKGMGKNLLTRMQSTFEAEEKPSENNAMVPVWEEAPPVLVEKSQPPAPEPPVEKGPSFGSRLGQAFLNFVRALFRLIALALVILGIGAAIYFGVPFVNNNVVLPIQRNTSQIYQLESQVATLQAQLDEMNMRVSGIESTIESQTATIAKLNEMQATLEQEATKQNNSVLIALKREVMLTRSIEIIARARLFLSQSNFGLARDDVQAARDILAGLLADAPAYQADALNQIIMRLDLALGNLPAFPVIAVDDVDIAWQLLMIGLPESPSEATIPVGTITVTFTFTPTPTPPPFPSFTPTLVPELSATPTTVP